MTIDAHDCRRCGRTVTTTPSGHTRAHRCPHGKWCNPPYNARRRGVRREDCAECRNGRQVPLF